MSTARLFKYIVLPVLVLSIAGISWAKAAEETPAKNLSKADIEKIVHDYILDNPQVILESVNEYQKKSTQARQDNALEKNKDFLFKDNGDPEAGNPEGDVTIVEFFDYNCHFCKSAFADVQDLVKKDGKVRVVFKEFPILGPSSETAAKWALAAHKQKKYFEFHKALMGNKEPVNDTLLEKIATNVGMSVDQAKKDITGTEILLQIEKNRSLANQLGINGTPAFVIGKEIIPGGIPLEEMERKVAEQRKADGKK